MKLSRSGELGEAMFSSKIHSIVGMAVRTCIDLHIIQHLTPGAEEKVVVFDEEKFAGMGDDILLKTAETEGYEALPSKRFIEVKYRGGVVTAVPVTCMVNEVEVRILAAAKAAAIWQGDLPELAAEKILNFRTLPAYKLVKVEPSMIEIIKAFY